MTDFNLISSAERQALLDAIRRHAHGGRLTPAAVADLTARVEAAQTHAGLDAIRQDLPPERPAPTAPWAPTRRRQSGARMVPLIFTVAAVALGFVLARIDREPDVPTQPRPTTTVTSPPTTTTTSSSTTSTTAPPTTSTAPPTTLARPVEIKPVTLQVGTDIQPGRYLSVSASCYWERWTSDYLLANHNSSDGHAIVDVLPTDARLTSKSCAWQPYVPPAVPATTFANGDWVVGEDIQPGRYQSSMRDHPPCTWERARGFSQGRGTVTATATTQGTVEVTVVAGERFTSRYCGTWTKVG